MDRAALPALHGADRRHDPQVTLEVTQGLAPEVALEQALALGREFVDRERCVFERWREQTEFSFMTCGEIQQRPAYHDYHRHLVRLFETDIPFRESVESFSYAYYRGRSTHLDPEQSIRRSVDYFLEEFAVFACLKQQGLPVFVYPGSFSTLAEIPEGLHPGAPRELRDLIMVSLKLKGRGSARSVRASSRTATP
uniref:Cyclodipeptide synthase n=1 Tax=Candidatus Kentrum sp. UNK TaxID=2126344 RepID=A0A451B672_9GAMM|nr:MAG: tRNA-dependent cyclodipeptide synthase [Candidatus Kentron sp. UNK]VFK73766.1 MAG: tRNA-dependent cyclodipeptide synthase [Candidatus Kentron sp. UNK]